LNIPWSGFVVSPWAHSGGTTRSTNFRKDESAAKGFFLGKSMSKFERYEAEKRTWLHLHPDATPEAVEQALRLIAKRLGV
jgi:hypothetical protein